MSPTDPGFKEIVDVYADRVYAHALRVLGEPDLAKDATQEVFLQILKHLHQFRGEATLATWIHRITFRVCRKQRKRKSGPTQITPIGVDEITRWMSDPNANPEEVFIRNESRNRIAALISRLPPVQASAITLYYMEGLRYSEIGEILDVPAGTVATAIHRGRERLREMITAQSQKPE
ncbi:MAG: RNA polymerase sigma factor [Bacteroidota bacterium]